VRELLKFDFFFAGRNEFADELWRAPFGLWTTGHQPMLLPPLT
jgi:hypothetical protein